MAEKDMTEKMLLEYDDVLARRLSIRDAIFWERRGVQSVLRRRFASAPAKGEESNLLLSQLC